MSKMSNLELALEELRSCGEKLIDIADTLHDCFSTPTETPEPEAPEYSFTDVRRILSAKSREGHTDEVRALLGKHGADKLSTLDPSEYAAIVREVEAI